MITLVGLLAMGRLEPRTLTEHSYYSEFQQCTIRTTPAGATIVAVDPSGRSTALGATPLSRSILGGWGAGRRRRAAGRRAT